MPPSIAMVSTIFVRTFFAPTISGRPGKKPLAAFATSIWCAACEKILAAKAYSSVPIPPEKEKDSPFIAPYWIARPQPLSREKGMHRFVWDLRYSDPPAIHVQSPYNYPIAAIVGATPLPPQGPLVMPGKYEVRLKIGEQMLRQPLEVKMDPRVSYIRNELLSSLDLQL